jgi:hypothetical protein
VIDCPWLGFAQQIDPHPFCEERLCAWIVEPANTWTNIGFLIAAIAIHRTQTDGKEMKRLFARATFTLFVCSALFHATGTVFGKMADVSAMFVLSMGILSLAIKRYFDLSDRKTELSYAIGLILSLAFLFVTKVGNVLFGAELLVAAILESLIWRKKVNAIDARWALFSLGTLVLAFSFWNLDIAGILCRPTNHILTGHGIWHLLTASSIYLLFRSYPSRIIEQR